MSNVINFTDVQVSIDTYIKQRVSEGVAEAVRAQMEILSGETLNRKQCAEKLNISPATFDQWAVLPNFPQKLPGGKWSWLAIVQWLRLENQQK